MSFSVESLILRLEKENTLTATQYEIIRKACKEEKYMQRFESIMRTPKTSYSEAVVKHLIIPFNLTIFETLNPSPVIG